MRVREVKKRRREEEAEEQKVPGSAATALRGAGLLGEFCSLCLTRTSGSDA